MEFTVTVTNTIRQTALQRAATRAGITQSELIQSLVDVGLDGFAMTLVVARIEPWDFLNRFTPAERGAIRTAAMSNGAIADYVAMLDAAPSVLLTDPLTMGGVTALEAAGLIGAGRAAEILAL